jgi:hypothetical protein
MFVLAVLCCWSMRGTKFLLGKYFFASAILVMRLCISCSFITIFSANKPPFQTPRMSYRTAIRVGRPITTEDSCKMSLEIKENVESVIDRDEYFRNNIIPWRGRTLLQETYSFWHPEEFRKFAPEKEKRYQAYRKWSPFFCKLSTIILDQVFAKGIVTKQGERLRDFDDFAEYLYKVVDDYNPVTPQDVEYVKTQFNDKTAEIFHITPAEALPYAEFLKIYFQHYNPAKSLKKESCFTALTEVYRPKDKEFEIGIKSLYLAGILK